MYRRFIVILLFTLFVLLFIFQLSGICQGKLSNAIIKFADSCADLGKYSLSASLNLLVNLENMNRSYEAAELLKHLYLSKKVGASYNIIVSDGRIVYIEKN